MLSIQYLLFVIKLIDKGILTTEEPSVIGARLLRYAVWHEHLIKPKEMKKENRKPLSSDFENKGMKQ